MDRRRMPPKGKLTDDEIRAIRNDEITTYEQLGKQYGITAVMVWKIKKRKSYKWVD